MDEEITIFDKIGAGFEEIFNFLYAYCDYCVEHHMI